MQGKTSLPELYEKIREQEQNHHLAGHVLDAGKGPAEIKGQGPVSQVRRNQAGPHHGGQEKGQAALDHRVDIEETPVNLRHDLGLETHGREQGDIVTEVNKDGAAHRIEQA